MKNFFFMTVPFLILLLSCTPKYGIERTNQALEKIDVEAREGGYALLRHLQCDIYAEDIGSDKFQKIINSEIYLNSEFNSNVYRIPKFHFFQIILKNTGKEVIEIRGMKLLFGDKFNESLESRLIKNSLKSPVYTIIDYKQLLLPRRLLSEKYSVRDINYDRDTLVYGFDFISPSDTVLFMVLFNWVPVQYRDLRLAVEFSVAGKMNTAEFNFRRQEYRTTGGHFTRPRKKIDTEP